MIHSSDLIAQLSYPSQPLPQALGFWLVGLLCLWRRRYRSAFALLSVGMAWLAVCSTPAFSNWLRSGLENRYPQRVASAYPVADAIVILGGAGMDDSPITPNDPGRWSESRTGFGLLLFRQGRAARVLLSGGNGEALAMAGALERQGVPSSVLMLETQSRNTHQNAAYSAPVLRNHGLQRILLVTSPIHMPRAVASFEKQGLEVIPAPTLDRCRLRSCAGPPWHPATVLLLTGQSLKEYGGMLYYRLRGWR